MLIGICDYGIGGIGLYKLLREKVTADIIYFSDSGFTPYGKVPENELKRRLERVFEFFNDLGVVKIAVACNAASTVIPISHDITGIIEHGINMVAKLNPKSMAVVGGIRTIESQLFKQILEERGIQINQRIAQPLSLRVEAGDIDSNELDREIEQIFEPIKNSEHILLACTHYPAIAGRISQFLNNSLLLDPAREMSDWIIGNWLDLNGNSTTRWITTGDAEQMKYASLRSFGIQITDIEKISL
jgi:glutamate racemase